MVAHGYGDVGRVNSGVDDDGGVIYGAALAWSCVPASGDAGAAAAGISSSSARYVSDLAARPPGEEVAATAEAAGAGAAGGVGEEVAGVAGEGGTLRISMVGNVSEEDEGEASRSVSRASMREMQIEASRKIRDFTRRSNLSEALKVMGRLQKEGVQPDTIAVSSLIAACVKTGNMSKAQNIFDTVFSRKRGGKKDDDEEGEEEKMEEGEEEKVDEEGGALRPDAVVFGILVRGYGASKTPQWGKISQLLASMERDYSLKPSTSVFNELLQICAQQNDTERGIELIDKMRTAELMPDYLTWEAVKKRKLLRSHFRKVFGGLL